MARGRRDGIVIAGGGLAGALAALAMARHRPDVPLMIVEESETFGGTGVHDFAEAELGEQGAALFDADAITRWPGFYVAFPAFARNLRLGWGALAAADLHRALVAALDPRQYRLGVKVVAVREDALVLDGGETIQAEGALDARGAAAMTSLDILHEMRLERDYRCAAPHGLDRPVLIDATVPQAGALRFMRCLPVDEHRLLVAELSVGEHRLLVAELSVGEQARAAAEAGARLDAYAALRGWRTAAVEAERETARPLPYGGDFATFWRLGGARVAKLGLRGGFVHPGTGRTLGDALRTAMLLTGQRDFSGAALHALFEAEAKRLWKQRAPLRMLPAALAAAPPGRRIDILAALYRLPPGTIGNFHADALGWLDRTRLKSALNQG